MLLQLDSSFEKVEVRNESPRLWTRLVCDTYLLYKTVQAHADNAKDCPEREATYVITTGGINDPEKA